MITLSLEKETVIVLEKSLEIVLIFGSKKPVMNPDFKSDVLAAVTIVYVKAPSYQGFWYFAEKKAKFRGIFRGKFAEKSADFAGF